MIDIKRILNDLRQLKEIKDRASKDMEEIIESLHPVDKPEIGKYYISICPVLWVCAYKIIELDEECNDGTAFYDCLKIETGRRTGNNIEVTISRTTECIEEVVEISEEDFNNFLKWAQEQL